MDGFDAIKDQLNGAQLAIVCWIDAEGGAHFVGSGTEQPLSRLKVIGLLESTKMMLHHQIVMQHMQDQAAAQDAPSA